MDTSRIYELYLPNLGNLTETFSIISADVRENYSILVHYIFRDGELRKENSEVFRTPNFSSFSEIAQQFIRNNNLSEIDRLAVAVPGPVLNGKSSPLRLPWSMDAEEIGKNLNVKQVVIINDIEASAYGLAQIKEEQLISIYKTDDKISGNVALLAPGNGLGEAGLFFDGQFLRPFATEGGHSEFSPRTNTEVEFYQFLNNIYGIVSWENVLSKTGIFNIYRFLRDVKRHPEPEWLSERLSSGDFTTEICKAALEDNVMICKITLDTYIEFLAREANSLVLKLKATGGLLIGGDIPMTIRNYMDYSNFYKKFRISDKMEALLENIPIYLLNDESTILKGSAYYAVFVMAQ